MTARSTRASDREYEVTPLELLFDLVFAVSQLSLHLLDQLSWRGAAETLDGPDGDAVGI